MSTYFDVNQLSRVDWTDWFGNRTKQLQGFRQGAIKELENRLHLGAAIPNVDEKQEERFFKTCNQMSPSGMNPPATAIEIGNLQSKVAQLTNEIRERDGRWRDFTNQYFHNSAWSWSVPEVTTALSSMEKSDVLLKRVRLIEKEAVNLLSRSSNYLKDRKTIQQIFNNTKSLDIKEYDITFVYSEFCAARASGKKRTVDTLAQKEKIGLNQIVYRVSQVVMNVWNAWFVKAEAPVTFKHLEEKLLKRHLVQWQYEEIKKQAYALMETRLLNPAVSDEELKAEWSVFKKLSEKLKPKNTVDGLLREHRRLKSPAPGDARIQKTREDFRKKMLDLLLAQDYLSDFSRYKRAREAVASHFRTATSA